MVRRGRGRGRGKPALQPLLRPGQVAVTSCDDELLVDLPLSEEVFAEGKGKEALPTGPISSPICCQQFVHRGSLGLHQPLIPVMVHGFTAMSGVSQKTPTTPEADVSQSPRERDPLEGLLYDPICAAGRYSGGGWTVRSLYPKCPGREVRYRGHTETAYREEEEGTCRGCYRNNHYKATWKKDLGVLGGERHRVSPRLSRANGSGRTEPAISPRKREPLYPAACGA